MTTHPRAATPKLARTPLTARIGSCGAVQLGGTCSCATFAFTRDVGLYRTCSCGHSQHVHAQPAAAPAAA